MRTDTVDDVRADLARLERRADELDRSTLPATEAGRVYRRKLYAEIAFLAGWLDELEAAS